MLFLRNILPIVLVLLLHIQPTASLPMHHLMHMRRHYSAPLPTRHLSSKEKDEKEEEKSHLGLLTTEREVQQVKSMLHGLVPGEILKLVDFNRRQKRRRHHHHTSSSKSSNRLSPIKDHQMKGNQER